MAPLISEESLEYHHPARKIPYFLPMPPGNAFGDSSTSSGETITNSITFESSIVEHQAADQVWCMSQTQNWVPPAQATPSNLPNVCRPQVGSPANTRVSLSHRKKEPMYFCDVRGCESQGFTARHNLNCESFYPLFGEPSTQHILCRRS